MALTRRQKQIYDYVCEFVERRGYSPSLEEIGRRFGLSSVATVHKHVTHLVSKGLLRRAPNVNRSIEPVPSEERAGGGVSLPLLGTVAAGAPIEALEAGQFLLVPDDLVRSGVESYALQVRGSSMIDEQIRDGDYVIVEKRSRAENGDMVIALLDGAGATLKRFYREDGRIRLQPANPTMAPIVLASGDLRIQGIIVGLIRKLRSR
jgi:repressor LexA